jgi:hypothetical protein
LSRIVPKIELEAGDLPFRREDNGYENLKRSDPKST